MLSAGLQLRNSQQATISPRLQEAIQLLQLSTLDLESELSEALETNVFLERDEIPPSDPPVTAPTGSGGALAPGEEPPEAAEAEQGIAGHLAWQVAMSTMDERDRRIAEVVLDAIDDDGFLVERPEALLAVLADDGVTPAEFEAVRRRIQRMEPAGCAALDLRDCLLAQVADLDGSAQTLNRVRMLICEDLAWLAGADEAEIASRLGCTVEQADLALSLLRTLEPAPGRRYGACTTEQVVPEVIVRRSHGRWVVALNGDVVPRLHVNSTYASMMQGDGARGHQAMRRQLQEARWLVKSLEMRNDTMLKVAGAIVRHQRGFLDKGEIGMRPMVLRDIAEAVGMHESTVSRITTRKYIDTPRGTFELKYFFSSRLGTDNGGRCSSTAVRALIRAFVDAEPVGRPLSDGAIASLLTEKGVCIARRTVAKYRESMGIPSLAERRSSAGFHPGASRPGAKAAAVNA
jgi:RNA polymerase sigma-54 factor